MSGSVDVDLAAAKGGERVYMRRYRGVSDLREGK